MQVHSQAPTINPLANATQPRKFVATNRFTMTIDGLDCTTVKKVSAITVRIPPGGAPQVSNIVLTVWPGVSQDSFKTWFESFVVQGNNTDAQEKNGTLNYGDKDGVLLPITMKGLGIVRMNRPNSKSPLYEVELYCEGVSVAGRPKPRTAPQQPAYLPPAPTMGTSGTPPPADAPPPSSTATPPPSPTTGQPVAKEGHADDKGARDPEGAPRFPECVRTAFTATRTKAYSEELGSYATKAETAKVEAWFTEQMKTLGWEVTGRTEWGKDLGYIIDVRWESGKKMTAKVTIGKSKDGATTIQVLMVTLLK